MITDSDYQTAKKALAHAVKQPDALSSEDIDDLSSIVEDYQKQVHETPGTERRYSMLAPEIGGPTGEDLLEEKLGTPGPQTVTETPEDKLAMSALSPQAQKAVGSALQGAPPRKRSEQMDEAVRTNEEAYSALEKQLQAQHDAIYDDKLSSASKVKDLYRDPEFIPPDMVRPGTVTAAMLHPMQARRALPSFAGGGTDHYEEPSLEQFQRNMVPIYGAKALEFKESSEAYKQYADAEWAKAYDQAKAEGRPIVRTAHMNTVGWARKAEQLAAQGMGQLAAGAEGVSEGASAGLQHRVLGSEAQHNLENAAENHPMARDVGRVVGAFSPTSIGGLAARGVGKVLPGMTGWIGSALSSGAKGAVAAGTDTAANDAVRVALDNEPLDLGESAKRVAVNSSLGGVIGGTTDLLGVAAGLHGKALRKSTRLGEAEELGAKTGVLKGVSPGPKADALRAEAYGAPGSPSVYAHEAEKLAGTPGTPGPLSEAAHGEHVAEERRVGRVVQDYYKLHEGTKKSVGPLLKSAMDAHEGFMDADGSALPWAGDKAGKLRSPINDMVSMELVEGGPRADAALRIARAKNPDAMLIPVSKAEARGLDLSKVTRGMTPEQRADFARSKPEPSLPFQTTQYGGLPPSNPSPATPSEGSFPSGDNGATRATGAAGASRQQARIAADKAIEKQTIAEIKAQTSKNMQRFLESDEGDLQKYLPESERQVFAPGKPSTNEPHLLVIPRKYNPQRVDEIVQAIDDSLRVGKKTTEVSPDYARLLKASREVRDQFPSAPHIGVPDKRLTLPDGTEISGWSAFKHEISESMGASQNRLKLAGISGPVGPSLSADQYGAFVPKLADYGKNSNGAPAVGRAQRELASLAGKGDELENIRRLHALESVEKGSAGQEGISMRGGAIIPRGAISARGVRLRLDPILSTLALPGGASVRTGGAPAMKFVPQLRGGTPGGTGSIDDRKVTRRKSVTDEEAKRMYDLLRQTQELTGE